MRHTAPLNRAFHSAAKDSIHRARATDVATRPLGAALGNFVGEHVGRDFHERRGIPDDFQHGEVQPLVARPLDRYKFSRRKVRVLIPEDDAQTRVVSALIFREQMARGYDEVRSEEAHAEVSVGDNIAYGDIRGDFVYLRYLNGEAVE